MRRVRTDIVTAMCVVMVLVLAGCAAPAGQPTAPGEMSAAAPATTSSSSGPARDLSELRGITWLMTAATVDGAAMAVPAAFEGNGGLTLTVGDGTLGGYDGCNWFGGPVPDDQAPASSAVRMSSTARGCTGGTDLARAYFDVLLAPFPWRVDDGTLRIGDPATHFDFMPFPQGFPSEVAGEDSQTIAVGTDGDLRFRVSLSRNTPGEDLCVSMEFYNEPGQNHDPVFACRSTDTARQYVVNPTDFHSSTVGARGLLLSAVPSGTATRIVVQQKSGKSRELTLTPIAGTDYLAFYGFVPDPQPGDVVLFYDKRGKQIEPAWQPFW